jgi:hypothetical protein
MVDDRKVLTAGLRHLWFPFIRNSENPWLYCFSFAPLIAALFLLLMSQTEEVAAMPPARSTLLAFVIASESLAKFLRRTAHGQYSP